MYHTAQSWMVQIEKKIYQYDDIILESMNGTYWTDVTLVGDCSNQLASSRYSLLTSLNHGLCPWWRPRSLHDLHTYSLSWARKYFKTLGSGGSRGMCHRKNNLVYNTDTIFISWSGKFRWWGCSRCGTPGRDTYTSIPVSGCTFPISD